MTGAEESQSNISVSNRTTTAHQTPDLSSIEPSKAKFCKGMPGIEFLTDKPHAKPLTAFKRQNVKISDYLICFLSLFLLMVSFRR